MRGHLQCRDTLAGNEGCPLKTGTTVAGVECVSVELCLDCGIVCGFSGHLYFWKVHVCLHVDGFVRYTCASLMPLYTHTSAILYTHILVRMHTLTHARTRTHTRTHSLIML